KMLYDNAQLLRVYTQLWRLTGDRLGRRVAREIVHFLRDALAVPTGGFASALDADTDGVEGATYVWTPAQLVELLGEDDGRWAADLFGVTPEGTFEHGTSVLRLARDIDAAVEEVRERWARVRGVLAEARSRRPQPARDDKVVTAWNGLAITALCEYAWCAPTLADAGPEERAAVALARDLAIQAGDYLARTHLVDGRLRRVSRDGVVGEAAGVLEDYGCLAEAFCALHQLTGEGRWLGLAGELVETALARFATGSGGFYDTADDAERLVVRPADPTDNATPSGLSSIAAALTTYSALTGEPRYRQAAEAALETVAPIAARHPRVTGYAAAVGEALLSGPYEIAIVAGDAAATEPLLATARRHAPPGAVVVAGVTDQPGVPLLRGRSTLDGQATAYVCRGFVCDRPVTTAAELADQLG